MVDSPIMRQERVANFSFGPTRGIAAKVVLAVLAAGVVLSACRLASAETLPPPAKATLPAITSPAQSATPTVHLATPEPSPTPACLEQRGLTEKITYRGAVVEGDVPVWVFLPPCYAQGDQHYPVLVGLHGYPYNESHWADLGLLAAAESGMVAGELPPMIIVLPRQPEPLYRGTSGGARSYEEELLEGLLPFVDSTFRTEARPESRTLAGISRGGVWSLEIGLRHPEVFGSVAGLSPALSLNAARGGMYDPLVIAQRADKLPARIYLMAGQDDWARDSTEELDGFLRSRGASLVLDIRPGGHADATWQPVMAEVLRFAAAAGSP